MSDNFTPEPNSSSLMDKTLLLAVPGWFDQHSKRDYDFLKKRSELCSQVIAEKGDVLMYGSKKKGRAGEVFNRLAEGIACLLLITKHPVPFSKTVFMPDGSWKKFETEDDANNYVWPKENK